jgi:hypothetical protein
MPSPYRTAHAAAMPSAATAALNAERCTALRSARHTPNVEITRISMATGSPQANRAARLKVTEATGASELDLPGVTTGQMSPRTIMAASTQNSGYLARCATAPNLLVIRLARTSPNAAAPARVLTVMWIHNGEPGRGPMSLVSLGSFMAPHRPPGR